jgi:hypothetical protein
MGAKFGVQMIRRTLMAVVLLSIGLSGANGRPAEARNEDVPKGPVAAPSQGKPADTKAPTGSVNTRDKKSAPSGDAGKGTPPKK